MSENKYRISRRHFLTLVGTSTAATVLAACAPQATPEPAEEPVEGPTAEPPPAEIVEIKIDAAGYTPSQYMGRDLEEGEPERVAYDTIANAYMDERPDVKITFTPTPTIGERREVMVMQLTGGTAPDMMWAQPDYVNEDMGKGWWQNLDPFMELPNLYCPEGHPGRDKWHDAFHPGVDFWRAPDGHLYLLVADQNQVGFFYNKDLFAEAGIADAADAKPKTWEDLMGYGEALLEADIPPLAWAGAGWATIHQLTWTTGWLAKYFFWDHIPTYDANQDGMPDKWEMADAIQAGTYSAAMEENVERLRQLKRMAGYWQEGALGMEFEATERMFLTGGAGMNLFVFRVVSNYLSDPDRDFDLGWFYYPDVTPDTSPLASPDAPMTNLAAGYGSFQYGITSTAKSRGTEAACADFLMWSTTPENIGLLVNEIPANTPIVKEAVLHPLTIEMGVAESVSYPPSSFQEDDSLLDLEYGTNFKDVVMPYCADQLGEAELLEQLQAYMEASAERLIATRDETQ